MAFFNSTAAELTRKCEQNRKDVLALYELLEKTDKKVASTETKVDNLTADVDNLKTDVSGLKTDVSGLKTDVSGLTTRVDGLDNKVDQLGSHFDERFDRLEQLIALPPKERDAQTQDPMRTAQEKRLSVLEMRMDVYNGRTSEHIEELKRHNRIFDAYDARFDTLDGQMTEVLSILRSKPA